MIMDSPRKSVVNSAGVRTNFLFDDNYNLQEVLLPYGSFINYKYDNLGRCIEIVDSEKKLQKHQYDLVSNVIKIEKSDGNIQLFGYDELDNLNYFSDKLRKISLQKTSLAILPEELKELRKVIV